MNKLYKAAAALLLSAALTVPQGFAISAYAETTQTTETGNNQSQSKPVVINYYLTDSKGKELTSVRKNANFNIRIVIRDLAIKTKDISGSGDIDFIKTLDTFKGEVSKVEITSAADALLTYAVELKDCKWTGDSNSFGFMTGYLSKGSDYTDLSVVVRECSDSSGSSDPVDDNVAEPAFIVKPKTDDLVIKAGESGKFELTIKNLGSTTAERTLIQIVPPEDIMVTESTASQEVSYITSGETKTIEVGYKALDKINSSKQNFTVNLTYFYEVGMNEVKGSSTASFSVASEISTVEKVYPVVMSEFSLSEKELTPDTDYEGYITLKNIGTADMKGIFVNLTDGDSFILTGGTSFCYISELAQGKSVKVPVKLRTLSEISSIKLSLGMNVKYTYIMGSDELEDSNENTFTMFAPISQGTAPRPVLTLGTLDEPISGGHKYRYNITVENKGDLAMENVNLTIKSSDGIIIAEGSDTAFIEKLAAGKKKIIPVVFRTQAELSSAIQYFSVNLDYSFTASGKKQTVQDERTLSLDAKISSAPSLRITGQRLDEAIKPNAEYDYIVTIHNYGDISVRDLKIDFTSSESLYFLNGTEFAQVERIRPGESADVTVRFKTTENISSLKQSISAAMKFVYGTTAAAQKGEAESAVTLIAAGADSSAADAAPNIIIGNYDIGADQIPAGEVFDLAFDLYNTSSEKKVENLVITVDASGSLSIYGGGNTYFYNELGAAASLNEVVKLRALPTAETGTSSVTISFKYDYMDGSQRNTQTTGQTIYIPVYQPDKMSFDVSVPTYSVYAGNEVYITTSYLNKGRSDIANVKAELVGDVGALSTSKVIGNIAPGGNGTFDFIVTPYMAGECSFTIKITYEDAMLNEVVKELPVSFMVEEMSYPDPGSWDMPITSDVDGEAGSFPWWIIWVGAGVIVVGGVITIICVVKRKKKKSKKLTADDIDWEDDLDDVLTDKNDKNDTTKV